MLFRSHGPEKDIWFLKSLRSDSDPPRDGQWTTAWSERIGWSFSHHRKQLRFCFIFSLLNPHAHAQIDNLLLLLCFPFYSWVPCLTQGVLRGEIGISQHGGSNWPNATGIGCVVLMYVGHAPMIYLVFY
ncbi:hypothetical protein V6N13_127609 [Hibiscus sabdariffa]|uniref:Uncharacterized protein n=2 Tax=Hibiscus sabdariffa TaxID=183260 RepID=A0ABR1Z5Q6_9ROSI